MTTTQTLRSTAFTLCLTLLAAGSPLAAQTIQVNKDNRSIAITATDKVAAIADVASVHIGFIAYGPDKDIAYAAGSRISNAIHRALTGAGVTEESIESENQGVSPVQEYQVDKLTPAEKQQRQFQVTQSWTVRSNAADASKVLDLAVKAGANQSGAIDWSLKDENTPQAEAAAKALQRAHTVAEQMARGLNVKLGALIYATNETEAEPIRPLMMRMGAAAPMAQKVEPSPSIRAGLRNQPQSTPSLPLSSQDPMPTQPERDLKPTPEAEAIFRRWLAHLNDEFSRHTSVDRRSEIVRDELFQIYLGRPHGGKINATLTSELAASVAAESFDPRNITLAAEYTPDLDAEQYSARKPLIYLWQMFDRSPLGLNHWLGFRLRCMLGKHIFKQLGKGVKIYPNLSFYYGYTLTIEDDCVLGENVQLDDRKPLTVPSGSNIPAFAIFDGETRTRESGPGPNPAQ